MHLNAMRNSRHQRALLTAVQLLLLTLFLARSPIYELRAFRFYVFFFFVLFLLDHENERRFHEAFQCIARQSAARQTCKACQEQ